MIGKICGAPTNGGSGRGAVRYILGYELGQKNEDSRASFHDLMAEAAEREDRGVGVIWRPTVGAESGRPSAVYARGVTSLATADLEMDAVAAANGRSKQPVQHLVFSISPAESAHVDDAVLIKAAEEAMDYAGLEGHQAVFSVHRDVDHAHVHVAVSNVHPETLRAWKHLRNFDRLSWGVREAEIHHGLQHDNGIALAYVGMDGVSKVRWASPEERASFQRERADDRLARRATKALGDYLAFEDSTTWVRDVVAPRIRAEMESAQDKGERIRAGDLHIIAASHHVRLEGVGDDVRFEVMRRLDEPAREARLKALQAQWEATPIADRRVDGMGNPLPPAITDVPTWEPSGDVVSMSVEDLAGPNIQRSMKPSLYDVQAIKRRGERVEMLRRLPTAEEAEKLDIEAIRADPSLVSREIVASGQAVFGEGEMGAWIARRVTRDEDVRDLTDLAVSKDTTLRVRSVDTETPLFTTQDQLAMTERVRDSASDLAGSADSLYDKEVFDRAIQRVEREKGFALSDEQKRMVHGASSRLSWNNGDAGTGKTTSMLAIAYAAQEQGRRVLGCSLSEKAARELGAAAQVQSWNLEKVLSHERAGERLFDTGDIVIIDEVSMTAMRQADEVFRLARSRGFTILGIGDKAQLQAIEAGSVHGVLTEVATEHGVYGELTEVHRQREEWHRNLVRDLGKAIRDRDEEGVAKGIRTLGDHGVLVGLDDREQAIFEAVKWYLDARAKGTSLLLASNRLDARHLNMSIRDELGLTGQGVAFRSADHGVVEVAVGDRLALLRNSKALQVANGDCGEVLAVELKDDAYHVRLRLDDGREITFRPDRYANFSHGYALTVHKGQGSTVERAGVYVGKGISAELLHVAASRATTETRVFFGKETYASGADLADEVAGRIQGKPDALLFDEIVRRTGGPDTIWAQSVREAQKKDDHPLRREHRAEMIRRREAYAKEVTALADRHADAVRRIRETMTGEERTHALRSASGSHRAAGKALLKANEPQSFVTWSVANKERIEREVEARRRAEQRGREREAQRLAEERRQAETITQAERKHRDMLSAQAAEAARKLRDETQQHRRDGGRGR